MGAYYFDRGMMLVPPQLGRLLLALTDDAPVHFRRQGLPVDPLWVDWRSQLEEFVVAASPPAVERDEPSVWLDVPSTVQAFAAGGAPVSERTVTEWARTGRLRARREGRRRWMVSGDDVVEEIEARSAAIAERKRIGSRSSDFPAESVVELLAPHLEAS
jgi:hypothetical protein